MLHVTGFRLQVAPRGVYPERSRRARGSSARYPEAKAEGQVAGIEYEK
jgi:hypothetical protein